MTKWRIDLKQYGSELKSVINDGGDDIVSCRNTLAALNNCYSVIKSKLSDEEFEDIGEEHMAVMEHIDTLMVDGSEERLCRLNDIGFENELDCVNDDLNIFYNICDDYRIWVGI